MSSTQLGRRLARSAPRSLREAVREREHLPHNLWWGYSYKLRRDIHCASDAALCHFVLLELDNDVVSYQLEAPELTTNVNGEAVTTRFDADVVLRSGQKQWHEVKHDHSDDPRERVQAQAQAQLAQTYGVEYCRYTARDFRAQLPRIWNGLRMLQTISSVADQPLSPARLLVVSRLRRGRCTLGELRALGEGDDALNLAVAFALVLEGVVYLSLDVEDLTDSSVLGLKEQP